MAGGYEIHAGLWQLDGLGVTAGPEPRLKKLLIMQGCPKTQVEGIVNVSMVICIDIGYIQFWEGFFSKCGH